MKKTIFIGILIFIALVSFLKKDYLIEKVSNILFGEERYDKEEVVIVLSEEATDISPYSLNLNNLIRSANIYQGLVGFDSNLRIIPALSISWGNINDTTWEFKLRKGVKFHDRSNFNAESVITSFNDAKQGNNPQIYPYLSNIKEIKVIDDFNIQIITNEPDPLLLSKLTKIYINKKGNIGTGPYKLVKWDKGNNLYLTAFREYWGKKPTYKNANYKVTSNKTQRKKDFKSGLTDILTSVPQDQALNLPKNQIKTSYSLEVNFLMFNLNNKILANKNTREVIRNLFDPDKIVGIGNNFVRLTSQFIAPGVYGFNSDIKNFEYNEENIRTNIFGKNRLERISLDYPNSYTTLIEYMQKPLKNAGFSLKLNALKGKDLIDKIKANESDIFLIGWQAEDGDAGGFLDAFVHSDGEFNNGRYSNLEIDSMIEESRKEMDRAKRLKLLQDIMMKIDEDLIGIPLFESSRLYAIKNGINWKPRLDGLVLATEVN